MNNKRIFLLLCTALSAWHVQAQEARTLSLQEAVELSLKNNKHIKLSTARIDEASATLRSAKENRLPDFSITGSYLRVNKPNVDMKMSFGAPDTSAKSSASPQVSEAMYGLASVTLPLFAGFKINAGIESAKYLEKAAKLDATANKEEVIFNTIAAYSNLYKATEAVELVQENLKSTAQRVKDFTNLEKNGLMARNDLLKAQLQESSVQLALLDAESNVKIATVNMNLMLGLPEQTVLKLDQSSLNRIPTEVSSLEDWESLAFQHRSEITAMQYREKAAAAGVRIARGDYYPSVALTGGYVALHVPNLLTVSNALNGGVGVKYSPSSLWKNGSKVAAAKSRMEQLQLNRLILDDNIRLAVNKSYQNYLLSVRRIDVYEKAVTQADENYRIVKRKHDNSLATTTELLDADVAKLQANINYTYGIADAAVAYNQLLFTTGLLSEQKSK